MQFRLHYVRLRLIHWGKGRGSCHL